MELKQKPKPTSTSKSASKAPSAAKPSTGNPAATRAAPKSTKNDNPNKTGTNPRKITILPSSRVGPGPDLPPSPNGKVKLETLGVKASVTAPPRTGTSTATAQTPRPAPPITKLNDAQVKAAQVWYAAKADQYTPQVLKDIQKKLGVTTTGKADTATVQAIAKWQATNKPLPINGEPGKFGVNGKADPMLLNHLFPTGLAKPEVLTQYTKDMKALVGKWPKLTVLERQQQIALMLNTALKASQTPGIKIAKVDFKDRTAANFANDLWQINLNEKSLSMDELTLEQAAQLADDLYHEARHAEQAFLMARAQVGKGLDPTKTLGTDEKAANLAKKSPVALGSVSGIQANAYYQSMYGLGYEAREKTLDKLSKQGEVLKNSENMVSFYETKLNTLNEQIKSAKDASLIKKMQKDYADLYKVYEKNKSYYDEVNLKFQKTFNNYVSLPEEADAWRIGGSASADYKKNAKK